MDINLIGLIGAGFLATCAIPQVIKSIKEPKTIKGISFWFIAMWLIGEYMTLFYYYHKLGLDVPTFINYTINCISTSILMAIFIKEMYTNVKTK